MFHRALVCQVLTAALALACSGGEISSLDATAGDGAAVDAPVSKNDSGNREAGGNRDGTVTPADTGQKVYDSAPVKKDAPPKKDSAPVKKDAAPVKKDAAPVKKDAAPLPAKPFGVWTSTCSATSYTKTTNNAYPTGFQQTVADDWTYIAWVWRTTPDAATNHSVSVMKSKNMKTWFNLCDAPVKLPVTPASKTVIDAVPIKAGLLNSRLRLSFDAKKRAVVTYQKHVNKKVPGGLTKLTTQVFNARREGKVIKIYQLTSWDNLYSFGGGGSLPSSDTAINFSGLRVSPSGLVAQTFTRSRADNTKCAPVEKSSGTCSAYPKSGTWMLQDGANGLALSSPLSAVSGAAMGSGDPWENPPTASLTVGPVENPLLSSGPKAAAWQVRRKMSRAETRWITLRADFDGDGVNNPGLFDRNNSFFRLDAGKTNKAFQFGTRGGLFWPLAGDWNKDKKHTIGIHLPAKGITYLKNSLAGGVADLTLKGPLSKVSGIMDSPLTWHTANPAARFAIKWESLPANRDHAYDCKGIPLSSSKGGCMNSTLMSSNLYLFEYDAAAKTWKKSKIDRAWGGSSVGFDFVTFKNVQLALYYGDDRYAKVAQRVRKSGKWSSWTISKIGTQFAGWDSHNYLTMTIDTNHNVHISGNMHASSLVYFRGTGSLGGTAALTYTKKAMIGKNESATTYPVFFRGPGGDLLFSFRSGASGKGNTFVNRYDEAKGSWAPMHGTPASPVPVFKGN